MFYIDQFETTPLVPLSFLPHPSLCAVCWCAELRERVLVRDCEIHKKGNTIVGECAHNHLTRHSVCARKRGSVKLSACVSVYL